MTLSIDSALRTIRLILITTALLALLVGWRQLVGARRLSFYILRRERIARGWRFILAGILFGLLALVGHLFGRQWLIAALPAVPTYTPTPSMTPTPTQTLPPTETRPPTITFTPSVTPTPSITPTPMLPDAASVLVKETITPDPQVVFSPIQVSERLDRQYRAINPSDSFENPIRKLFGAFTYDHLSEGVRWTALWLREGEIVCMESLLWDDKTGGFGFTECELEMWYPGDYEIQIFVGDQWMVSTSFVVIGDPPTLTPTPSHTPAPRATP